MAISFGKKFFNVVFKLKLGPGRLGLDWDVGAVNLSWGLGAGGKLPSESLELPKGKVRIASWGPELPKKAASKRASKPKLPHVAQ